MRLSPRIACGLAAAIVAFSPGLVHAGSIYVSGSIGAAMPQDSDNSGSFPNGFTTGTGTTIPSGTSLPAGAPVGWKTEFDTGLFVSGSVGWAFNNGLRLEAELSHQTQDVDTHTGVTAAGIPLGSEDAAVLISGSPALGISVSDLVADGQGKVESTSLMLNAYYNLKLHDSPFSAYVGAGLGLADVDVDYKPSDVTIIEDGDTVFAYQLMAGLGYALTDSTTLYGGYRYRATEDIETTSSLFPATLKVENSASIVEVGLRYAF